MIGLASCTELSDSQDLTAPHEYRPSGSLRLEHRRVILFGWWEKCYVGSRDNWPIIHCLAPREDRGIRGQRGSRMPNPTRSSEPLKDSFTQ